MSVTSISNNTYMYIGFYKSLFKLNDKFIYYLTHLLYKISNFIKKLVINSIEGQVYDKVFCIYSNI